MLKQIMCHVIYSYIKCYKQLTQNPSKSHSRGNTSDTHGTVYPAPPPPPRALALAALLHPSTPGDTSSSFHLPPFVSLGLIDNPAQLTSLKDSTRRSAGEKLQPQAGKKTKATPTPPTPKKNPNQTTKKPKPGR